LMPGLSNYFRVFGCSFFGQALSVFSEFPFSLFFFLSDMKVLGVPQTQIEKRFSMLQPFPPNPTGRRRVARGRSVFEKVLGGLENAS